MLGELFSFSSSTQTLDLKQGCSKSINLAVDLTCEQILLSALFSSAITNGRVVGWLSSLHSAQKITCVVPNLGKIGFTMTPDSAKDRVHRIYREALG